MQDSQIPLSLYLVVVVGVVVVIGIVLFFMLQPFHPLDMETVSATATVSTTSDPSAIRQQTSIATFTQCAAAGNPIIETDPRTCNANGKTFTEILTVASTTRDLLRLDTPVPYGIVSTPLTIKGEAPGSWYFESSFPVLLEDAQGNIIAQGTAAARGNWMTTDLVPFTATLSFSLNAAIAGSKGTLVLKKDNPSGLPQNDNSFSIPIVFGEASVPEQPATSTSVHRVCPTFVKLCPDGSTVKPTGPNCEVPACPSLQQ